jgi:hypothetical protein
MNVNILAQPQHWEGLSTQQALVGGLANHGGQFIEDADEA